MRGAEKYVRIIIILESLTKQKIKKVNAIDKIREIFRRYFQLLFYIFREGQGIMFGYNIDNFYQLFEIFGYTRKSRGKIIALKFYF